LQEIRVNTLILRNQNRSWDWERNKQREDHLKLFNTSKKIARSSWRYLRIDQSVKIGKRRRLNFAQKF